MTPEPTDKPTIEPCYMPECGGECDTYCRPQNFPKTGMVWTVECLSCGYATGDMYTEAEASTAHNGIARKLAGAEGLRDALQNALASLHILAMPQLDDSVATNADIIRATIEGIRAALANAPDAGEGGDDDSR